MNTSKQAIFAVVLIACAAISATAQTQPTSAPAIRTFKSHPYKFTINLPATWHDKKPQPTGTILAIEPDGPKQAIQILVDIKGSGKFKPEQLDELLDSMKDQAKKNDDKAEFEELKDDKLGEVPAKRFSYVTTISEMKLKFVHVVTIKNGRAYVVEVFAPVEKFENVADEFAAAVSSFTFTTP